MSMKQPLCTNDGFVMGKKSRFCIHDNNNVHPKQPFLVHVIRTYH